MKGLALAAVIFCAWGSVPAALADDGARKYGVDDITVSDAEKEADLKYGGFPNNQDFNNDTRCTAVIKLFDTKNLSPQTPEMVAFLRFSKVKLMELDIAISVIQHTPPVIDRIDPLTWKSIPALIPQYCRNHPRDKLEDAEMAAFQAARLSLAN